MKPISLGLILFAVLLASCTSLRTAPTAVNACSYANSNQRCVSVRLDEADADGAAKKFALPTQDRARLYIVRSNASVRYQAVSLQIDRLPVATIGPYTFATLDVSPGWHTITIDADEDAQLRVNVAPGETYFISADLVLLFNTISGKLRILGKDQGQSRVLRSVKAISLAPFK